MRNLRLLLLRMTMAGAWLSCYLIVSPLLECRMMAADAPRPKAKTAQGKVAGKWILDGSQKAFLGLPYAAPPTGPLRWRSPKPPASWTGTRDATKYAGRCEQYHIWNDYIFQDAGPTEDCLYLNVYAPASAQPGSKLPVMFWIHGGGFVAGSGSEPRYSNSGLVPKGVVLVTINYRLGVFGFLTSEELAKEDDGHAGNYGLMDMVAALRWVKANIARFGGDAANVTIFGESAGSFAVNALTVAPDARGLFQKAIGESGAFFGTAIPMSELGERNKRNQEWIESLGVKNLAELRDLPASKIIAAVQKQPGIGFAPVIDAASTITFRSSCQCLTFSEAVLAFRSVRRRRLRTRPSSLWCKRNDPGDLHADRGRLEDYWTSEIRARHARRNKIRAIDEMLNQFEMLNLADEQVIPADLCQRVAAFVRTEEHPLCHRDPASVAIPDWMEALYDVQDGLMIRFPDDID